MEYLAQKTELVMEEFFNSMKYAKQFLICKGWILERTNELRIIICIKRRMQDGTKKFVLKFEQDINSLEDVRCIENITEHFEHFLSKKIHLNTV